MSKVYIWDLGFDFNNAPDPDNDNLPPLQNGLVEIFPSNQLADLQQFKVGDTLGFNGFNITTFTGSQTSSAYSITGGSIKFSNADNQSPPCPYDTSETVQLYNGATTTFQLGTNSAIIEFGSFGSSTAMGPSTFFTSQSEYPRWWPIVSPLTVVNIGKFNVTMFLTVQGPNGSGVTTTSPFRADPEMIVGSAG